MNDYDHHRAFIREAVEQAHLMPRSVKAAIIHEIDADAPMKMAAIFLAYWLALNTFIACAVIAFLNWLSS